MLEYTSIPSAYFETAIKMPQSPAYRYRDNNGDKITITYKELYDKINAIAKAFEIKGFASKMWQYFLKIESNGLYAIWRFYL